MSVTVRTSGATARTHYLMSSRELHLDHVQVRTVDPPTVDIVFVHGLGGDARTTWHPADDADSFWPLWLATDFPTFRVRCLGYPAEATKWTAVGGGMALPDRAASVADYLAANGIGRLPIVFIAHSLGGLLVKQILRIADQMSSSSLKPLLQQTKGVVFLATPHSGSDLATLADALPLVRPTHVAKDLRAHSPYLRELGLWFSHNAERFAIKTAAYYETQSFCGVMVVDPTSADPKLPSCLPIPVDADHFEVAKPTSFDSAVYQGVVAFLRDLSSPPRPDPGSDRKNVFYANLSKAAWPRMSVDETTVFEGVSNVLGSARRAWLSDGFKEQLAGVLVELALNAFRHGAASSCELAVYERTVVFSDNGSPFNPLEAQPTERRGRVGVGIFALHHFLAHADQPVVAAYTNFTERDLAHSPRNEIVFTITNATSPRDAATGTCVISLRQPVDQLAVRDHEMAHLFDIPHGCSDYLIDWDCTAARIIRTIASIGVDTIILLIKRLPPEAVLRVRIGNKALLQDYFKLYSRLGDRLRFE